MAHQNIIARRLINKMYYVIEKQGGSGRITLFFGGKDIQCIEISLHPDADSGVLHTLVHDKCCNKTTNLENGLAGTVVLANIAFNYLRRYYPAIRTLEFDDDSNKYCVIDKLENVSLMHYYVAFYGMTWYQRQFGAEPHPSKLRDFTHYIGLLTNEEHFRLNVKPHHLMSETIKRLLSQSIHLSDFFRRVKDEYRDTIELCLVCQPWMEEFMDRYVYLGSVSLLRGGWSIIISRIPHLELFKIEDITDTTIYSKQPNQNMDFKRFECNITKQRGSGVKKILKVYLRVFDKTGFPNDIYLGSPDNYKANRDKLCREKNSCIGLIVYK
jgi:hypothetical protein